MLQSFILPLAKKRISTSILLPFASISFSALIMQPISYKIVNLNMEKASYKIYNSAQALENARLLEAANKTYTERFYTLMKLIKLSNTIKQAKIISSPKIDEG
jgi:hypothetical protein